MNTGLCAPLRGRAGEYLTMPYSSPSAMPSRLACRKPSSKPPCTAFSMPMPTPSWKPSEPKLRSMRFHSASPVVSAALSSSQSSCMAESFRLITWGCGLCVAFWRTGALLAFLALLTPRT